MYIVYTVCSEYCCVCYTQLAFAGNIFARWPFRGISHFFLSFSALGLIIAFKPVCPITNRACHLIGFLSRQMVHVVTSCCMLHNNHHLRAQRPDAEWRGAGGGQMKCHFLNIFRSGTPRPPRVHWPVCNSPPAQPLHCQQQHRSHDGQHGNNKQWPTTHLQESMNHLSSVSEICLRYSLRLPRLGAEL